MSNRASAGSGGSGAGYHAIIKIDSPQTFNVICGSGGIGYGGPKGANRTGTDGTASSLSTMGNNLIYVGGGTGGFAAGAYAGATRGTGGSISISPNLTEIISYTKVGGNSGNQGANSSSYTANGAVSVISGHTWGASGSSGGWSNGGSASPSYHGYVLIKYLGQDNPIGE